MAEGRAPISSSRIATGDIAQHSFAVVRRGFDTDEVRSYLQSVARSLEALEAREEELRAAAGRGRGAGRPPGGRRGHPDGLAGPAQRADPAPRPRGGGPHRGPGPGGGGHAAARDAEPGRRAPGAHRGVVGRAGRRGRAAGGQRRTGGPGGERAHHCRGRSRRERRSSPAPRTRAGRSSTRCKRRGAGCWPTWPRGGAALGIQIEQLRAARDEMAASVHGVRDRVDGILTHLDRTDEEARAAAQGVADQFRLGTAELPHDQDDGGRGDGEAPPTGPTPVTGGASGDGSGEDESGAAGPSVDELFARIRAGSAETEEPAAERGPDDRRAGPAGGHDDATAADGPATARALPEQRRSSGGATGRTASRRRPRPRAEAAARAGRRHHRPTRRAARRRSRRRLSRTIKRTLGDDQNRLLDRLRSAPALGRRRADGLRGRAPGRLRRAARSHLDEAFAAGTVFVGAGAATVPRGDAVEQASTGLARAMVTTLRRQIAEGQRRPGRPRRRRLPRMARRTRRATGRRPGHAGLLGGGGCGQRGRQGALGRHDRERLFGLRGQRAGRRGERVRGVPHRARPPAGALGLPLPHRPGDRLTRTSGRRIRPGLAVGGGAADVRLPSCASPAT